MTSASPTRRLARQGAVSLLGAGVSAVAGLALVIVVTRGTDKAQAGVFFSATSLFLLVYALARLGTPTGLVWALARQRALGETHRIRPTLRVALLPVAAAGVLVAMVLLMAPEFWARTLLADGAGAAATEQFAAMVRALALFVPAAAVYDAVTAATRGFGSMRPTVLIERVARPLVQVIAVGLALLGSSAVWLAAAWALPYLPALAVAIVLLGRAVRASATAEVEPAPRPRRPPDYNDDDDDDEDDEDDERPVAPEFWRFTAPRSVADVAQMVAQRLDIVLVGALRGPVDAALYTAATRFLAVGQAAGQAISLPAQASLGEVLARDDRAAANALYRAATAWLVLITWPFYFAMLFAAPLVLALFGPGYQVGVPVMAVLSVTMLVATACGMVDTVLVMAGRTTWSLVDMLVAVAIQVVLDLLLIPGLGILGAAIGWAAAILVKNLAALVQIRVWSGLHPFDRVTLIAFALAGGCFGVVPAVCRAVFGTSAAAVLGGLALAAVCYAIGVHRLRWILRLDALPLVKMRREGRHAAPENVAGKP